MKNITLAVPDMSCGHCVSSISEVLEKINSVKTFEVKLDSKEVYISLDESQANISEVVDKLDDIGFASTVK